MRTHRTTQSLGDVLETLREKGLVEQVEGDRG